MYHDMLATVAPDLRKAWKPKPTDGSPMCNRMLLRASLMVVSITTRQSGFSCTNRGKVGGKGLESNKDWMAVTGQRSEFESRGIYTNW